MPSAMAVHDRQVEARQLEGAGAMQLQAMRIPGALHRCRTHPLSPSHGTQAPICGGRWLGMQSRLYDLLDARGRNRRLASPSPRIFTERRRSTLLETPSRQNHARPAGSQLLRNLAIGLAFGSQQDDAHTKDDLLRSVARSHPTRESTSLLLGQLQRFGHAPHHTWTMTHSSLYVKLFVRHSTSDSGVLAVGKSLIAFWGKSLPVDRQRNLYRVRNGARSSCHDQGVVLVKGPAE